MDINRRTIATLSLVGAVLVAAQGCGNSSGSPTGPSGGGGSGATVTITASGISPSSVTVSAGQQVTFVNNSQLEMTVASDPHPTHTDCPAINNVGTLQPGQSRLTGTFTTTRTCGFHDHDHPDDASRRGSIMIK